MRKLYTDAQTRSFLLNRIRNFVPRISRTKATKAAPPEFTLEDLAEDLRRTLVELDERIAKKEN